MSFNIFNEKVTDNFSTGKPQEFESDKERAEFYFQKYTKGLKQTIDWNDQVDWTQDSREIIHTKIAPKVAELEKLVGQIIQHEGQAEIDQQLAEKPVLNYKVEGENGWFVIKDATTGVAVSKGDTKIVKGFLEVMHKMQNGNPATTQEKPQPVAETPKDDQAF